MTNIIQGCTFIGAGIELSLTDDEDYPMIKLGKYKLNKDTLMKLMLLLELHEEELRPLLVGEELINAKDNNLVD